MQRLLFILLIILSSVHAHSQVNFNVEKNASQAKIYLKEHKEKGSLSDNEIDQLKLVRKGYSKKSGVTHLYFTQTYNNIEIYNAIVNVHLDKTGKVIQSGDRSVSIKRSKEIIPSRSSISQEEAIEFAAKEMGITSVGRSSVTEKSSFRDIPSYKDATIYENASVSIEPIAVKQMYVMTEAGVMKLVWDLSLFPEGRKEKWNYHVDATNGEIVDKITMVSECSFGHDHEGDLMEDGPSHICYNAESAKAYEDGTDGASYNVFAIPLESPNFGPRSLVTNPADDIASPFGWHDTNGAAGAEYTITRGNNVYAYFDVVAPNGPDANSSPDGGATLNFDFPLDLGQAPATYRPAAVTNMFYMSNIMHDWSHKYGFDEANSNFQTNNYGNGGVGGDPMNAEAQDYAELNNAKYFHSVEGTSPRIQMYLWNFASPSRDGDFDNGIIGHEYGHGISIRLTGNGSTCLNNEEQMGEGWSDYFGYMTTWVAGTNLTSSRGVGTYVLNQAPNSLGIRTKKYSYDLAINDFSYDDIKTLIAPHGVGSVWATMLWDMTLLLIQEHGETLGLEISANIVMEGLKLQPCRPGFVDGRDAILLADQLLYGGGNNCIIWDAFARRGLGVLANQGLSGSKIDGVEDFTIPASLGVLLAAFNNVCITESPITLGGGTHSGGIYSGPGVTDNGNGTSFTFDPLIAGVGIHTITYTVGAYLCFPAGMATAQIEVEAGGELVCQSDINSCISGVITYAVPTFTSECLVDSENFDGVLAPALPQGWTSENVIGVSNPWKTSTTQSSSTPNSVFATDNIASSVNSLTSIPYNIGATTELKFKLSYNLEQSAGNLAWDGLVLEYKTNQSNIWQDITEGGTFSSGAYNKVFESANPLGVRPCWSGNSGSFIDVIVALNANLAGNTVRFRWRLATDQNTNVLGAKVDDIILTNLQYNTQVVQTAGLPSGSTFPVGTTTNTFEVAVVPGYTVSCSFDVNVAPPFVVTATAIPNPICQGGTLNLDVTAGESYNWSGPNSFSSQLKNPTISNIQTNGGGLYQVTVTNVDGCTDTASVNVIVNPTPATPIITPGGPTSFCPGGSVTLTSSSAIGNKWYKNGNPIGGETNQTYIATASGNYTVDVTALGCSSAPSATTAVTINNCLNINDVTQNEGNAGTTNFTFTVSLSAPAGAGGVTFDIATADGTAQDDIPASEDNDYIRKALSSQTIPAGSSKYTFGVTVNGDFVFEPNETFFVNVTNVIGASVSNGQGLGNIMNDDCASPPTPTITLNGPTTFCAGSLVTLSSSSATGNQWYMDGNPIGGANNQTYNAIATGNYTVIVTASGCSSAPSIAVAVTVIPIPDVVQPSFQIVCNNSPTAAVNFTGSIPGTIYNWTNNTPSIGLVASGSGNIASFTATNATTSPVIANVTVTPTTSPIDQSQTIETSCMAHFDQTDLAQSFKPAANALCGARILTYSNGSGTGDITIQLYSNLPNAAGVLLAQGTVTGIGPNQWAQVSWPSVAVTPGTTYYLVFTSTNIDFCVAGDANNPYPDGQVYANSGYGSFPAYDYAFETFSCGIPCTGTPKTFTIIVNPTPVGSASPQTICTGTASNVALNSTVTGTTYTWTAAIQTAPAGGTITGFSNCASSCGSSIAQTLTNTGTTSGVVRYTVTPTANGCPGTPFTVDVTVDVCCPTIPTLTTNPTPAVCSGNNVVLTASGLTTMNPNSYGITFKYFSAATATPYIGGTVIATVPNGSLTGGGTGATTTTNTLPVGNNFIYAILSPTPVDVNCRPSATANITVNPLPVVTTAATATICSGTATSIALTASTDPGTTFTWTIGTITGGISGASACASACGTTIAQTLTNFGSTAGSVQYLVTPVSSLGCTGAAYTITVTVNPTPNAVATPASQTICSAGTISTIVLSGSVSGTTYAWTRNNAGTVTGIAASGSGNISGALTNTTAAPITVTFTITPSANGCSGAAITATVLVNPTPNAVATPASQTICSAGTISTIVLSGAVSGTTYAWTRDNNASVTGIAASGSGNISGSLTNTTSAPITVTFTITPSANGCSGAAITATVLVNPTPNSVATPASQTICSAATISTIVLSGAVSGTTYAWTRDNTASVTGITASGSGNISGALTNTTASPITVTFTITPSANGCPGTAITATVLVNPTPNAIATTPSQTICSGPITTIALSGAVSGTVFNWTRDNMAAVPGIAASGIGNIFGSLTNTTSSPVTVTFTITPTANGCSGTPITATVVVNPTPSYTFTSNGLPYSEGDTITACNQDVLALTITSPVTVNYTFTRLSNGNVISSGTTPATFNYTANNAREGFYEIGIANSSGCILKDTIYLLVNPLPNPTATATPNPICQGGSLQLGVNGNNNFTFAWSGPNGFTSNVKNPTINGITPAGSGVYTVTVTNLNGCSNTSTISVLVNPTPTAIATPTSQTICSATSISTIVLTGAVSGTTYAWTRNNTGTVTGIAASGSGNISGTLTNTTNAPVTVTFTITPTANGCVGLPITATVLVNPKPTAVATPASQTICSGFAITTITLTGTASGTTYTWIRNNTGTVTGMAASGSGNISGLLTNTTTAPITVTFTITPSANGCVGTPITATVLVNPSPVGTISVAPNPGCVGSTVQFSATGGTTYSWSGPLGWTSTQQNPTILLTTYLQGGKYEVTITNGTGCSIVLSTRLEVFYPPIATATYETSTACTGSTLLLHGTGAGSYSWSGPNGFTSNQQNPQIPNVTAANSGLYTLIVTSPNGCSATSTINITINTPPALSANPTLTQTCEGGKIQLFATGSGSFVWTGPATYTSTDQNPVIANIPIHLSGIYTVSLTASTGCISTASVEVKVYDQIHAFASASEDTICQGQSLQLHAEGGSTYLWNGPNGFNSNESDPRIDNITPKQSGKYYVYITNEGGCFGYAELTIVVKPSAKSSAYASPNPVNENTPVQFFASSNGVAYSWSGPLGFTSNVQNPSIKKVTRYMSGVYTVTITNENGCPSIVKVILKVLYTNKGGQTINGNEEGLSTRSEVTGTVYPNPTNDILYFDTQSAEAIEYVIYDVNGKMQVVQKTTSDRYISTSQLSSGVYQIRWKSKDSDKWIVSKFVKIR